MLPTHQREPTHDVANFGLARPPLVYLGALLSGAALDLARPLRWLPAAAAAWAGVPSVLLALALFIAATRQFKAAGTPVYKAKVCRWL